MIKLRKVEEPPILRDNAADWLKTIQDKLAVGEVPTEAEKGRYRHPEIKAALVNETYGKCAYCESKLLHVAFGDVEHISPKSHKLEDTFRWNNLTLACDRCNTNKGSAVDLVDPYDDDPDALFRFLGPMVYARPENAKAVISCKRLRLNRAELVEMRSRRLEAISNLLVLINEASDPQLRSALIDDLAENEVGDNTEYAAFVRNFLATVAPDLSATI